MEYLDYGSSCMFCVLNLVLCFLKFQCSCCNCIYTYCCNFHQNLLGTITETFLKHCERKQLLELLFFLHFFRSCT